jgi:uncharacterized protein (TIGR02147 family)
MLNIYAFRDYRRYLKEELAPHGRQARLAEHLKVPSVTVSQVLSAKRDFSLEQAFDACEFFALDAQARKYFLLMVQSARAGSARLRAEFEEQMKALASEATQISMIVPASKALDEVGKAIFYSDWRYSAVRIATSIPEFQTASALQEKFGLPSRRVREILDFLLRSGLCKLKDGRFQIGPTSTHLDKRSPWIGMRSQQWRQKAVESLERDGNVVYTAPVSLAREDADKLRSEILSWISAFAKRIEPSKAEVLWCLNLDWFEV